MGLNVFNISCSLAYSGVSPGEGIPYCQCLLPLYSEVLSLLPTILCLFSLKCTIMLLSLTKFIASGHPVHALTEICTHYSAVTNAACSTRGGERVEGREKEKKKKRKKHRKKKHTCRRPLHILLSRSYHDLFDDTDLLWKLHVMLS